MTHQEAGDLVMQAQSLLEALKGCPAALSGAGSMIGTWQSILEGLAQAWQMESATDDQIADGVNQNLPFMRGVYAQFNCASTGIDQSGVYMPSAPPAPAAPKSDTLMWVLLGLAAVGAAWWLSRKE